MGSATQDYMVLATATGLDDEILLIQNGISSDTWLMDAITTPVGHLVCSRLGLLTGRGTSCQYT